MTRPTSTSSDERPALVAFSIDVDGFGPMVACAASLPKARYLVFQGAHEVGFSSVTFARIRGRRNARFDAWAAKQKRPIFVGEEYALLEMN